MRELQMQNGDVVDADDIPPGFLAILEDELSAEQLQTIKERIRGLSEGE